MLRSKIGRTGVEITAIGFGTSGLGDMPDTYGYAVDEERARATVRAIFDGPANLIDTSRIYGAGRSEQRIGDVIRERGGLPAGFVVRQSSTAIWKAGGSTHRRHADRLRPASKRLVSIGSTFSTYMTPSTPISPKLPA